MASVRLSYRWLAAFLAVLLAFSGALPLVAHACGMMDLRSGSAEHAASHCCCGAASAMHEHAATHEREASAGEHCSEAAPPAHGHADAHHAAGVHAAGVHVQDDCCTSTVTQARLSDALQVEQSTEGLLQPALAPFSDLAPPLLQEHRAGFRADPDRPRAPSQPLHVLYAVFLN